MSTISAEEVSAVCFAPLTEAPERLGVFFANVVYSMDGLETTFYAASYGSVDEAIERMEVWHTEFAHLGYRGWAESYLAEIQRQNKFTLPARLTDDEQAYLDTWRERAQSLISRSSALIGERRAP